MQKEVDEFKAGTLRNLCETLAGRDISNTAKLIAVLEAAGYSREDIERYTDSSPATYRRAKAALKNERSKMSGSAQKCAPALKNEQDDRSKMSAPLKNERECSKMSASPARGVVPNPTTVECVSTQDRSPSPLPPYSPPIPSSPPKCDPDGVKFDPVSKTISLDHTNRAFWLEQFDGDAGRLDLALIEAAGSIQPNNRQLFVLQFARAMARIAGSKRDSDKRYARAAAAKQAGPAQPRMDLNARKAAEVAELRRRMKVREEAANAAHH